MNKGYIYISYLGSIKFGNVGCARSSVIEHDNTFTKYLEKINFFPSINFSQGYPPANTFGDIFYAYSNNI